MNSVRLLNRSVFAAIFLVTICYGSQDLRLTYKMPRSSHSVLTHGRERAIIFPRSIRIPILDDRNRNLVDFKNEMQQQLNGSPRRYKSYENDHEMDLDAEKNILQEILQNDNALGKLPYFYNNLIESHDKVADSVQKYSDNDFTKRGDEFDEIPRGNQNPNEPGPEHGKVPSLPSKIKENEASSDGKQSVGDEVMGIVWKLDYGKNYGQKH